MTTATFRQIVVVGGICASGKNHVGEQLARRLGWNFIDADIYHLESAKRQVRESGLALWGDWDDEEAAREYRRGWIDRIEVDARVWLEEGIPTVLACSVHQQWIRKKVATWDLNAVHIAYLFVQKRVLRRRIASRKGHFFPPNGLKEQWRTQEAPKPSQEQNVIVVDGNPNGSRSKLSAIRKKLGIVIPR